MSARQMPSYAVFEECQSAKCLHLQCLRNARAANAFTGSAMLEMPYFAVFQESGSARIPRFAVFCKS
eukprot:5826474-Amphidinium_carterae.1